MPRGSGSYLGVEYGWQNALQVNESALQVVFDIIRHEAVDEGCSHFPGRDDLAVNETLLDKVIELYEKQTGQKIANGERTLFQRWILLVYKAGGTPNN